MADEAEDQVPEKPKLDKAQLQRVGRMLKGRFERYKSDRRGTEQQWMQNLRQILGQYDPEVLNNLAANQSRAYPRITRVKCNSMVARLMSLLFPSEERNWSLSPSPRPSLEADALSEAVRDWQEEHPDVQLDRQAVEQAVAQYATKQARKLERVIDDQLADISDYGSVDYPTVARRVVKSAVEYSLGVLKGPMTLSQTYAAYGFNEEGEIEITPEKQYRPYYQWVPVWDYYPDMSAASWDQMEGQFQHHVFARHRLLALADREDFYGDEIKEYVSSHSDGNYTPMQHETELRSMGDQKSSQMEGSAKYEVLEYWGQLSGSDLASIGVDVSEENRAKDYRVTVWVLDSVVVKAAVDPFKEGTKMYHQFVFEEDDVNLAGRGLPPIMRDSQMAVANASRMLLDNASVVCGPQLELDLAQLMEGQDFTSITAFKVWLKESQAGHAAQRAVQSVSMDSHLTELSAIIDKFNDFADVETFVGPMTGGDFSEAPSEPLRTTGGMSMALSNAALPFRDIVRNFDQFTISVIHSLVDWNRIFNPDPSITGDTRPVARGATALMAKEMRAAIMDSLSNTLTEEEEVYIDRKALLKHRLSSRDLPLADILLPDSVVEKRMQQRSEQAQQAEDERRRYAEAELKNLMADTFKQSGQAQKHLDSADVQVAQLVLDAMRGGINPQDIADFINSGQAGVTATQGEDPNVIEQFTTQRQGGDSPQQREPGDQTGAAVSRTATG